MTIRTILESIRAWFNGPSTEKEPVMADPTPEVANAPATNTDTVKLKALLIALGHDVDAQWEHLVALSQKAD